MNRYLFHFLLLVALFLGFSSIAVADIQSDIDKAEQLHQQAVKLEGGWTTTTDYIKSARKHLLEKNTDKAHKASTDALTHAQQSLVQAQQQLEQWRVPSYILNTK